MKFLNNLRLKQKFVVIILIPLVGLLYFSISISVTTYQKVQELNQLQQLAELGSYLSVMVHDIQKERGATAGYLGSNGDNFKTEIEVMRTASDVSIADLSRFLQTFEESEHQKELVSMLDSITHALTNIRAIRDRVDVLSVDTKKAISTYTDMNTNMIGIIGYIARQNSEAEISTKISAQYAFMQSKERAGVERAVLSNTFDKDTFGVGMYPKFISMISAQNSFSTVFLNYASPEQKQFYTEKLSISATEEVARMRTVALNKGLEGGFGIDPNYWFTTMTTKINALKEVEDKLASDMVFSARKLRGIAYSELILSSLISVLLIVVTVFISGIISRKILQQIGGEPEEVLRITKRISEGYLSMKDYAAYQNTQGILGAVLKMGNKLSEIIGEVSDSVLNISSAGQQLSASSLQLSKGATEQATSVEEISASMEEMSANIQQNAANAQQTEQMTNVTSEELHTGSDSVNETAEAMQSIVNKVSLIDEISRQTNLLALNAAVEASRAGVHGRGFSVVAAEIRKLAERCQVATNEIGEVSETSISLALKSENLFREMLPNMKHTSGLVKEIATASMEQQSGTLQINSAVQQFNKVVQQNAANAEELAASSEQLSAQADRLSTLISFFSLEEEVELVA